MNSIHVHITHHAGAETKLPAHEVAARRKRSKIAGGTGNANPMKQETQTKSGKFAPPSKRAK